MEPIVYLLIHEKWPIGIKRGYYMEYPSWSVYLSQVSEYPWRTSVRDSLIGNIERVWSLIVRYHTISCTSQLFAMHIWTLQGYAHLMRGMPINPPFDTDTDTDTGSADRLQSNSPVALFWHHFQRWSCFRWKKMVPLQRVFSQCNMLGWRLQKE